MVHNLRPVHEIFFRAHFQLLLSEFFWLFNTKKLDPDLNKTKGLKLHRLCFPSAFHQLSHCAKIKIQISQWWFMGLIIRGPWKGSLKIYFTDRSRIMNHTFLFQFYFQMWISSLFSKMSAKSQNVYFER